MTGRLAVRLVLVAFQLLLIWQGVAAADHDRFPAWLVACETAGAPDDALCGSYPVWEDRESRSGRRIDLFVAVLPATGPGPVEEPIFPLAGGPGQGASSFMPYAGAMFGDLRRSRDLVLLDQRGTGRSASLDCESPPADGTLQSALADFRAPSYVRRCLEAQDADVSLYTTEQAVGDLEEIRGALGYERINLFGGSYGTRAALHYLRRHPAAVRAVVVDGVWPSWTEELHPFPRALDRTLDHLFRRCEADESCARTYPELRAAWTRALERFRSGPVSTSVLRPDSPNGEPVVIDRVSFTDGVRRSLYGVQAWGETARIISAAGGGDFSPFVANELRWQATIHELSLGMLLSVTCSETTPYLTDAALERATRGTSMGNGRALAMREACAAWKRGKMPDDWREPFRSETPILLLSGAIDPATPFEMAASAAAGFPNGLHLVIPNRAHAPTDLDCEMSIIRTFLQEGRVEGLKTDCVEQTAWPEFRAPRKAAATSKPLDPESVADYLGRYEIAPGVSVQVLLEDGRLFVLPPGGRGPKEELVSAAPDVFTLAGSGPRVTFERDERGTVHRLVLENGPTAEKVQDSGEPDPDGTEVDP